MLRASKRLVSTSYLLPPKAFLRGNIYNTTYSYKPTICKFSVQFGLYLRPTTKFIWKECVHFAFQWTSLQTLGREKADTQQRISLCSASAFRNLEFPQSIGAAAEMALQTAVHRFGGCCSFSYVKIVYSLV